MNGSESRRRFTVTVDVQIRPARAEDLEALEWMGLFTPHRSIIRTTFRAQERGEALMLLGIAGGFPIAQVWIDFERDRARQVAAIWAVRTFSPLQGSGIGARMMAAAEDAIRARGLERAELQVERDNAAAKRFYRKLGWRPARRATTQDDAAGDGDVKTRSAALELVTFEKRL
jgi:ribosomal protein S18 acetylase RimI-like enzyme